MSDNKKSKLTTHTCLTTGGLGALLTTIVPALIPDEDSLWRPVLYATAPIVSAGVAYLIAWFASRHGLESPAEAALRNSLERDLRNIDKQLNNKHITSQLKDKLLREREKTVLKIVNIGKNIQVTPVAQASD